MSIEHGGIEGTEGTEGTAIKAGAAMPGGGSETPTGARVSHPIFARLYACQSAVMERAGIAEHRDLLLAGLAGHVVEVGAGNGLNFAHYRPEVTRVLAIEPDPHLRGLAERAAARAAVPVEVVAGVAGRLPAADAAFDAAVVSLVLCSVPDQRGALAELRRVVRGGGQLRFLEHVRADGPRLARVQRLLDATVWPLLVGGCHTGRDTAAAIRGAGFRIESIERFRFPESRVPLPTAPHIRGTALRTDGAGST
jgi:ubiquinone/menaquinone biosynthesis C-methylase UbiE